MFTISRFFTCLFLLVGLFNNAVHAFPIAARADSTTVTTVSSTMTSVGPMTETCVITLTPITDSNGDPAVQEVKTCKLSIDTADDSSSDGSSSSSSADSGSTSDTSTADSGSATTTSSVSTSTAAAAIVVNGFTTVTDTPDGSAAIATSTTAVDQAASSAVVVTSSAVAAASSTTTTAASSTTASAAAIAVNGFTSVTAQADANTASVSAVAALSTGSATAAIALPGKTLSVLPIGLGVFAGISVIALIVVGLVTYERTKYRKAFRQRKLAESGSAMGYGGMAQRT